MIPTPYEKYIADVSSPRSVNFKLAAWLCSTTFIVSPLLADAFDFKLEHNAEGSILHVERFDNKHLRSNSPDGTSRKASFHLNNYLHKEKVQHDGLTIKLEKVVIKNEKKEEVKKIRIKLFKEIPIEEERKLSGSLKDNNYGSANVSTIASLELLGYLDVNDNGTVHVSNQATSDHLFITSTKDIYLDGHTTKGSYPCSITLQTDANVYLDGIINAQNLHVVANQIISRDSTEMETINIRFKAKQLTTSGEYNCACVDIDVENDWDNQAGLKVTDCLSIIRTQTVRNRRKIEARRFIVHTLSHFDNSNVNEINLCLKLRSM